ncbi:hypothetical protein [Candidatus Borrarchaeum sp.]|uniref:sodium:calcium antiporter n=1 Tax=Candidatus Borrarchaeum sp. TaxID=2846742 RepID=UPI00257D8866|nr:hypothetical protein [Candidatus Borrarchaeum sp.]
MNLLAFVFLFIGAYVVVYFGADVFIDGLKDFSEKHHLSPLIIGLLILGVDPEESVASIFASIEGLQHVAIGNVIGNTIIAITIAFGLPALFFSLDFERIPRFYPLLLCLLTTTVILGVYLPKGLLIFGSVNLALFGWYLLRNIRAYKVRHITEIIISDDDDGDENNNQSDEDEAHQETKELKEDSDAIIIGKSLLGFILIIIGGFFLIFATENIIIITGLTESLFGFLIIAWTTNAEELFLIVSAIRKHNQELGIGAEIGKVVWNLGVTFGISGIILQDLTPTPIYPINLAILVIVILMFTGISIKNKLSRRMGILFLLILVVFVIVNSVFGLPIN